MSTPSSPPTRTVHARPAWPALGAAALVVPTVLAALTLLWPRPQLEADLTGAADRALAAAGLDASGVAFAGRDATISGLTGPDGQRAVEVVEDVDGVRVARLVGGAGGGPAGGVPAGGGPVGDGPAGDGATGDGATGDGATGDGATGAPPDGLDPAARAALQGEIDALVAAAPITFAADSPALTPAGERTVQRIVALVAAAPDARVQVDGFVATGPAGRFTALELSELRAATVRDALVAGGVTAGRVTVTGRGEGDTPAADVAGRRAAVTVV